MSSIQNEQTSTFASPPPGQLLYTDPTSPPPSHVTSEGGSPSRKRTHTEMAGDHGQRVVNDGTAHPDSRGNRSTTPTPGPRFQRSSSRVPESQTSGQSSQENANIEEDEEQSDPTEELPEFDWDDLGVRYHKAMEKLQKEEAQIGEEFNSLLKFFYKWAQTTAVHEVDRSFTRLNTRKAHVHISEAQLKEKTQHYMRVVKAFESALSLLNAP